MHRMRFLAVIAVLVCSANSLAEPIRCKGHTGGVTAVAISPDGKLAVSCGDKSLVRVWNTSDGSEIRAIKVIESEAPSAFISDAAFSPDGQSIVVASSRQPITFWDVKTWKRQDEPLPVAQTAHDLAYSPDGSKVATAEHAAVRIWDWKDKVILREFKFDGVQIGLATSVTYSPDGLIVAAALQDYGASFEPRLPKVQAWNALTGDILFTAWNSASATAVAISSKDSLLTAASGPIVEVWSLRAHESFLRFAADENAVFCLAFSPDGEILATGGNDPVIKLWDVQSGTLTGTLKGHTGQVHDLCFSADGKTMISGGTDEKVLIWKLATDVTRE